MGQGIFPLYAFLLLSSLVAAASSDLCPENFNALSKAPLPPGLVEATESVFGKSIRYKWITDKHPALRSIQGGAAISAKRLDAGTEDDLFIGFDRARNHAYLVFRRHRLDGGFAVTPLVQPMEIKHNTDLLSPGIIFRVRDLSSETKDELERILSGKNWGISFTCVRGVCGTMKNADLSVNKQLGKGSLPMIPLGISFFMASETQTGKS